MFAAVSVNVPVPVPPFVRPAADGLVAPEMTPEIVASIESDTWMVASAVNSIVPLNVAAAEKFTAPADDAPGPAIFSGSAEVTADATSSVAPEDTSVRSDELADPPSADATVTFSVPPEILVRPV